MALSHKASPAKGIVHLVVTVLVVCGELMSQDPAPLNGHAGEAETPFDISGYLTLSYRGRLRSSRDDQDLYAYLSVDAGDPEVNDVSLHLFGRATYDLDGDADDTSSLFGSLSDVFDDQLDVKLYEAFVELRRSWAPSALGMRRIRLGRQEVHAAYTYLLDGARIDFEKIEDVGDLEISVFGGIPELLYDSSRSGDWLVGAEAALRPFDTTRVELRYVHAEDRNDFGGPTRTRRDDYASIAVRQRIGEDGNVSVEWTTIDARTRDVFVRLAWEWPDVDFGVRASYRYQKTIDEEFTPSYDPYVVVLGTSYAYHNFQVDVSKLFGDDFGIDAGFNGRVLDNDDNTGPFNRQFARTWLTASTYGWPIKNVDLSITGEYWNGDDDETATAGFELDWRPETDLRFTAGTYYSLYKYDLFIVDERTDATTLFFRVRWDLDPAFRIDARYEFETGDEGDFHALWAGVTWRF